MSSNSGSAAESGSALDKAMLAHAPKIRGSFWIFLAVIVAAAVVFVGIIVALWYWRRRVVRRRMARGARGDDLLDYHPAPLFFETDDDPNATVTNVVTPFTPSSSGALDDHDKDYIEPKDGDQDYSYSYSRDYYSNVAETAPLSRAVPSSSSGHDHGHGYSEEDEAATRRASRRISRREQGGSRWQSLTDSSDDEDDDDEGDITHTAAEVSRDVLPHGSPTMQRSSTMASIAREPASFGLRDYYSAQIAARSGGDAALGGGEAYPATPLASTPPASPTRARRFSQSRPPPVLRGLQAVASADGGAAAAAAGSGPPSPRSRRLSSGAEVPALPSSRRSIGGHEDVAPPPPLPPSLIAGYSPRGPPRSRPQSLYPRRAGPSTEGDAAADWSSSSMRPRSYSGGAASLPSSSRRRFSGNGGVAPPLPPLPAPLRASLGTNGATAGVPISSPAPPQPQPQRQEQHPDRNSNNRVAEADSSALALVDSRSTAGPPETPPPCYAPAQPVAPAPAPAPASPMMQPGPSSSSSSSRSQRRHTSMPAKPRAAAAAAAFPQPVAAGSGSAMNSSMDTPSRQGRGEGWPSVPLSAPQPAIASPRRSSGPQGGPAASPSQRQHPAMHRKQSSQGAQYGGAWWHSSTGAPAPGSALAPAPAPAAATAVERNEGAGAAPSRLPVSQSQSQSLPQHAQGWYIHTWQGDWDGAKRDSRGFGYV